MSVNLIQNVKDLDTNIRATFKTAKEAADDKLLGKLYDITPVKGTVTNIVTLTDVPGMREFKSERVPGVLTNTTQSIQPRTWESTLAVKRQQIEDDDLGQIPAATRRMANKSKKHYGRLAAAAASLGFTANLADGNPFFHASRGNLQSGALTDTNFNAARLKMQKQAGADGEMLDYAATLLVVGPDNQSAAEDILLTERLANGASNKNYKRVELLVTPGIKDSKWFLIDGDEGYLPITIAERIKVGNLIAKTDLNSDKAFDRDIFEWGLRGRYDAAYVDPQLIVGSTGS